MPTRVTRRVLAGRLLRDWQRAGGQGTRSPGTQVAFPHAFTITPWMSWSAWGGTNAPTRATVINAVGLGYTSNTPADNGDFATWNVEMAAGTWSFRFIFITNTIAGTVDVTLDGSAVATLDIYSAGLTYNVTTTTTGIVVPSSGVKTLKILVNGKNVSASDYFYFPTQLSGVKTA